MYLNFYDLKKEPFHITPDPEFLYLSPSHKEALAAIIYGIEQKKGFVAIIGDVGVGKTTILRSYLDTADRTCMKVIYVFNARLTFEGLLKTIYEELDLPVETNDTVEMVNDLYQVLIEEYKQGNTIVLVIDEAQNMPVETLESLRMFSNLETSKDKLIQIVLVGQVEFEEELNLARLRQLKQRIAIRSTILPLTKTESLDYIKYRLQKAGSNHGSIFTNAALRKVVNEAKGTPRLINILCDNTLITGFGYQQKPASVKVAREVIADFRGKKRQPIPRWWFAGVAALIAVVAGIFVFSVYAKDVLNRLFGVAGRSVEIQSTPRLATSKGNASEANRETGTSNISQETKQQREPSPLRRPAPREREVRRGDTLTGLLLEEYGRVDQQLIDAVKQANPQMINPNVILPGSTIVLPEVPESN